MNLKNEDIKEIAELLDGGMICYIHKETHKIESLIDMDDPYMDNAELWEEEFEKIKKNRDAYLEIKKMSSREAFRIMEDFVDEVQDEKVRDRLIYGLNRRSPFRNFKNTVDYHENIRQQWFKFKAKKYEEWVRKYIKYNSREEENLDFEIPEINGCFDDDGNEYNPNLHPLPNLCLSCRKKEDPSEEVLCNLTRLDQIGEEEFKCLAYESTQK